MTAPPDPHKPLRDDVSMLGEMLGDMLRARHGPEVFETVERVRRIAKAARQHDQHALALARRTLAAKHARIAEALARQDRPGQTAAERDDILEDLRREILAMWGTEDVRLRRPTPIGAKCQVPGARCQVPSANREL